MLGITVMSAQIRRSSGAEEQIFYSAVEKKIRDAYKSEALPGERLNKKFLRQNKNDPQNGNFVEFSRQLR